MNQELEQIIMKIQDAQEELAQYMDKMGLDVSPELDTSFEYIMDIVREME